MCSLRHSAGVRISNEAAIEKWVEYSMDGVVEQTVTYRCLVNVARFWISNIEGVIAAVYVILLFKFRVKKRDIVGESVLKYLYVMLISFSPQKLSPRQKPVVGIPVLVVPIEVEVPLRAVPVEVRHVPVVTDVRGGTLYEMPSVPPPLEYSPG